MEGRKETTRKEDRKERERRKEGMKDETTEGGRSKERRWIKNKIEGKRKCKRTK